MNEVEREEGSAVLERLKEEFPTKTDAEELLRIATDGRFEDDFGTGAIVLLADLVADIAVEEDVTAQDLQTIALPLLEAALMFIRNSKVDSLTLQELHTGISSDDDEPVTTLNDAALILACAFRRFKCEGEVIRTIDIVNEVIEVISMRMNEDDSLE